MLGCLIMPVYPWFMLLLLQILGKRYSFRRTKFTEYYNSASYSVSILCQSISVAFAHYVVQVGLPFSKG